MATRLEPLPVRTALVDGSGRMTSEYISWYLLTLIPRVEGMAAAVSTVDLTGQNDAIGTTSLVASASGLYRVSYRFRVTTAAGTSSSLTFTVGSTSGGVACTQASATYSGNVTNVPQSGVFIVKADAGSVISYSTTYASNAANVMVYELQIAVDRIG